MRILIVGGGSIGTRHLRNLKALGCDDIAVCDLRPEAARKLQQEYGVEAFPGMDEALAWSPNLTVIATPTVGHVSAALAAAGCGSHLFIEKPLSDSLNGVDELIDLVESSGLVGMVGCNMRFHHGPSTIKGLLNDNAVGPIMAAHIEVGQFLPDWHPDSDYREGYSARRELGGGIIFDAIHEIDYARWLFGEVVEVFGYGGHRSSLQIDTEDCVDVLMAFAGGMTAHVHLDYIQRAYSRSCKVIGESGTITWDITQGLVRVYTAETGKWRDLPEPDGYESNDMYLRQFENLLQCVDGSESPSLNLREAKRALEIALAVKTSVATGIKREV